MDVSIRTRGFSVTRNLRAYVERRLSFALDRYEDRITRVRVTLEDVNGPKGGPDKSCRMEVRIRDGRTLSATVVDPDAYAAIAVAVRRAARGVARAVEHERALLAAPVSLTRPSRGSTA